MSYKEEFCCYQHPNLEDLYFHYKANPDNFPICKLLLVMFKGVTVLKSLDACITA